MTRAVPAPAPLDTEPTGPRSRWPLIGAAAGALGVVGTLICDVRPGGDDVRFSDPDVINDLSRPTAQVGIVAGYLCVAALLVLAAAWRRRVEPRTPNSTASRVVSAGLVASAGALMLGYGWKGALSVYLDGGMDEGAYDKEGLFVYLMLNDFGAYIGWLGATVAAGAIAWMALRERTISRWIGWISVLPVLAVAGFTISTGLPGFPGVVSGLWMVVALTGLAFGRSTIAR